jgi:hypothetical protein
VLRRAQQLPWQQLLLQLPLRQQLQLLEEEEGGLGEALGLCSCWSRQRMQQQLQSWQLQLCSSRQLASLAALCTAEEEWEEGGTTALLCPALRPGSMQ